MTKHRQICQRGRFFRNRPPNMRRTSRQCARLFRLSTETRFLFSRSTRLRRSSGLIVVTRFNESCAIRRSARASSRLMPEVMAPTSCSRHRAAAQPPATTRSDVRKFGYRRTEVDEVYPSVRVQSQNAGAVSRPSRWRPPAHAANQATAAPTKATAAAIKAKIAAA